MTDAPDPENCLVVFNSLISQLSFQLGPHLGKGKNPRALMPFASYSRSLSQFTSPAVLTDPKRTIVRLRVFE